MTGNSGADVGAGTLQPLRGDPLEMSLQAQIAGMNPERRRAASRAQEQLAAILHGLMMQSPDLNVRLSIARRLASLHPEMGIDPETITADDVSDPGIVKHVAAAMSLKRRLDQANAAPAHQGFTILGVE